MADIKSNSSNNFYSFGIMTVVNRIWRWSWGTGSNLLQSVNGKKFSSLIKMSSPFPFLKKLCFALRRIFLVVYGVLLTWIVFKKYLECLNLFIFWGEYTFWTNHNLLVITTVQIYSRSLDSMESPTWEVNNGEIPLQKPILPGWR